MAIMLERVEDPHRKRWTREECSAATRGRFPAGTLRTHRWGDYREDAEEPTAPDRPHAAGGMAGKPFGRFFVQTQDPIVLPVPDNNSTEPEPDVAVTRSPTTSYHKRSHRKIFFSWARSRIQTLPYDLRNKAALYAAAGFRITGCWMSLGDGSMSIDDRPSTATGSTHL